jgi:hypothetical protein
MPFCFGSAVLVDAFRQDLGKLGWIDEKNIAIESRFAEQKRERVPKLVTDLVRLNVDRIVASDFYYSYYHDAGS